MDSDGNRMQNNYCPINWGHSTMHRVPPVSGSITAVCVSVFTEEVEHNTTLLCAKRSFNQNSSCCCQVFVGVLYYFYFRAVNFWQAISPNACIHMPHARLIRTSV